MAKTTRSAATERAYLHFARGAVVVPTSTMTSLVAAAGAGDEDFDESDIWGMFASIAEPPPRARPLVAAREAAKPATDGGGRPAHGSLPVKIPDWSKILGNEYRPAGYHGGGGDWEVDDDEDSVDAALVPPHELVWRRRAASLSLSLSGVVGRTLKVRDAVWKRTTGFQD